MVHGWCWSAGKPSNRPMSNSRGRERCAPRHRTVPGWVRRTQAQWSQRVQKCVRIHYHTADQGKIFSRFFVDLGKYRRSIDLIKLSPLLKFHFKDKTKCIDPYFSFPAYLHRYLFQVRQNCFCFVTPIITEFKYLKNIQEVKEIK